MTISKFVTKLNFFSRRILWTRIVEKPTKELVFICFIDFNLAFVEKDLKCNKITKLPQTQIC